MAVTVNSVEILLLISAIVAILARRLKVPYTVGLLLAGTCLALARFDPGIQMTKQLLFLLLLPPLVFQAAFSMSWKALKQDLSPLLALSVLGVLIAAGCVSMGMVVFAHWDWRPALLFSVLISATDPVSVISLFRDSEAGGRLKLLVEGESLINDGTAASLFAVALVAVSGVHPSVGPIGLEFLRQMGGGVLVGAGVGLSCLFLTGRTEDHLVEVMVCAVAAFGAFIVADRIGASGVLSTLVAGLVLGNVGPLRGLTVKGREAADTFWEFVAFVSNSLIFLLMGAQLARQTYHGLWLAAVVAICLVLISRAISVYGVCFLFKASARRIDRIDQHLLVLMGLRGALALALALGLPVGTPGRDDVVTVTFAVVSFSILVQGLTIQPVLARVIRSRRAETQPMPSAAPGA